MCGIFGYVGSKAPDISKIKILGLYNQSRGEHSCGLSLDGVVKKGVIDEKLFSNFIAEHYFPKPKNDFTVIGHTRQASGGTAHTAENAHPFVLGKDKEMIFTHNGIITNAWDLCKKYDVPYNYNEVDSLTLARIIYKTRSFKVLAEYRGFAALAFYDRRKPNSLYLFKGASNDYNTNSKEKKVESERPLFYLQSKTGTYYSSLANPLFAIREANEQEVYILEPNIVFLYENGQISKEFKVNRPANINEEKKVTVQGCGTTKGKSCSTGGSFAKHSKANTGKKNTANTGLVRQLSIPVLDRTRRYDMYQLRFDPFNCVWTLKEDFSVKVEYDPTEDCWFKISTIQQVETLTEVNPQKKKKGKIYYFRGRYWRNGHLVSGNLWVNDAGEYEFSLTPLQSMKEADRNAYTHCYFYRGVLLETEAGLASMMAIEKEAGKKWYISANFAYVASAHSLYPVVNMEDEGVKVDNEWRFDWFLRRSLVKSGSFIPFLGDFMYEVTSLGQVNPIKPASDETILDSDDITVANDEVKKEEAPFDPDNTWPDYPECIEYKELNQNMRDAIFYMLMELVWKTTPSDTSEEELSRLFLEYLTDWNDSGVDLGTMCKTAWGLTRYQVNDYVKLLQDIQNDVKETQENNEPKAENEPEEDVDEPLEDPAVEPANGSEEALEKVIALPPYVDPESYPGIIL